jgi:hypothetical protein
MKRQQDQEQVIAAEAAAVASLTPWVKDGRFEMRNDGAWALFESGSSVLEAGIRIILTAPDGDQYLIEKAVAGDVAVNTVLRKVISEKLLVNETLSPNLRQFLVNHIVLIGRNTQRANKGGRPAADFNLRDSVIYATVETTIDRGFRPTRNEIPRSESACSIVASALEGLGVTLSEKTIAGIWRERYKQLGRWSDFRISVVVSSA